MADHSRPVWAAALAQGSPCSRVFAVLGLAALFLAPLALAPAQAGQDAPPGQAKERGPVQLRVRNRAVTIEDYEYLKAVASGTKHSASFAEAVDYVSVQAALIRSTETGQWEDVVDLTIP